MEQRITPKQLARATGVSESSIKRWCDAGDIATVRTPGGHRRIPLSGAIQFLRSSEHELLRPQVLGLPSGTRPGALGLAEARGQLTNALASGDESLSRQILFELYLYRRTLAEIGDQVIAPAFAELGRRWEGGSLHIFQERQAFEIVRNLLHELRLSQTPPAAQLPVAIGGTIAGDQYSLAPILVELVLRENGWRATYLGSNLPAATWVAAMQTHHPHLFWLSVSHIDSEPAFLEDFDKLREAAGSDMALVIGGRAVPENLKPQLGGGRHCATLQDLEDFSRMHRASLTRRDAPWGGHDEKL